MGYNFRKKERHCLQPYPMSDFLSSCFKIFLTPRAVIGSVFLGYFLGHIRQLYARRFGANVKLGFWRSDKRLSCSIFLAWRQVFVGEGLQEMGYGTSYIEQKIMKKFWPTYPFGLLFLMGPISIFRPSAPRFSDNPLVVDRNCITTPLEFSSH